MGWLIWSGIGVAFTRADGSTIAAFMATGRTDVQSVTSEYEIFRGGLAKIFLEPVMSRVRIMLNETVASYVQHDDSVDVTFANSRKTESYDLLVAADGLGSRIRGMMLGTKPSEQIHDEGVHVCYFTIKRDLLQGSKVAKWYNATNGRVIFLRPDPAGHTRVCFLNIRWRSDKPAKQRFDDAVKAGNAAYMALMDELFTDAGWLAPEVLKGMHDADDFYCSLFGQTRCPRLQDGRVVLLGDAAHATPGFGTSLAIIDGYVLAGELLRNSGGVKAATKAYEELLMPFVKSQQGDDVAMQLGNPQSGWGLRVRNAVLIVVTGLGIDRLVMSAGAYLGFTEAKLKMPEYAWPAADGSMAVNGE